MDTCIECPNIDKCHDESIGDLQMIRAIDGFLKTRNIVKAEDAVALFWKRLRERHQRLTGR